MDVTQKPVAEEVPSCFKRAEYLGREFKNCMFFENCKNVRPICLNNNKRRMT